MKNIQKILIAILALVLVTVVAVVIFVKTDNNDSSSESNTNDSYTLPDEYTEGNDSGTTLSHNHEDDSTDVTNTGSHNGNTNNTTKNNTNNDTPIKNDKTFNFTDSKVLQTQKSSFGEIKILSAKVNGKNVFLLEATVKDKKFYYEFPGYYNIENVYYANVDGYYGDEVIIHANTGGNGGAGSYDNIVLKITSDGIISLFDDDTAFKFLTSFSTELKENFNVEISNKYTGFKKTVNVKGINNENYADSYWDENGKLMVTETLDEVWIDETFYIFEPKDVDNDGYYEITCSQYASLGAHASCIGSARTTLKYDRHTKQFMITDANFYLPA